MKLIILLILLFLATSAGCETFESTTSPDGIERIDTIKTDNYANQKLKYFYYIPSTLTEIQKSDCPLLVMVPGLSGRGENFVSNDVRSFANKQGFVIIAPSFVWDEENWDSGTSYQYPSAWSGDALIDIIDHFETQNDVTVASINLLGYSAGAQFALRFCVWKPELCTACVGHASGGGVAFHEYIDVDFMVTVGKNDQDFRISNFDSFCSRAGSLGINVDCRQYDTDHSCTSKQIQDSLNFIALHN